MKQSDIQKRPIPSLSVVIPAFNEEENIEHIVKKLLETISKYDHEIIFVNDGSKDATESKIESVCKKNKRVKLVSFVKNYGHQYALSAGYANCGGQVVVTIDADLQDPPELIVEMIELWRGGYDIVYGRRKERHEGFFKKITASGFYRLMNMMSDTRIPNQVGDFRLLDKSVVEVLNDLPEKSRFWRGLVPWTGFKSTYVDFDRPNRLYGSTQYPFSKMMNFALNGIVDFSTKPLRFASYLGIASCGLGFLGIFYALARRFLFPHDYWVTGWTALFVAVMFFGGVQLLTIGIIGEYIGKIYRAVQDRPAYLVKKRVNF